MLQTFDSVKRKVKRLYCLYIEIMYEIYVHTKRLEENWKTGEEEKVSW